MSGFGREFVEIEKYLKALERSRERATKSGQVTTPEGFEPHAIYRGRVWGVFTNDLDVESVRAYALKPPAT